MIKETFIFLYERDLQKTIEEIGQYNSDEDLWTLNDGIANSGGNLALHIIGNTNHYFGANLGNTGYTRERDLEFSDKNVSRDELIERLRNTISVLRETLENLSDDDLRAEYPEELGGGKQKTFGVIIHMLTHLNYHLGQINYHRRLLQKK